MQFHILAFEGPDAYARAGGIASRVTGLSQALAAAGFDTHVWFVDDPALPGHDTTSQKLRATPAHERALRQTGWGHGAAFCLATDHPKYALAAYPSVRRHTASQAA